MLEAPLCLPAYEYVCPWCVLASCRIATVAADEQGPECAASSSLPLYTSAARAAQSLSWPGCGIDYQAIGDGFRDRCNRFVFRHSVQPLDYGMHHGRGIVPPLSSGYDNQEFCHCLDYVASGVRIVNELERIWKGAATA
jgi:hypothetical protein